jgi:hypothetical protein
MHSVVAGLNNIWLERMQGGLVPSQVPIFANPSNTPMLKKMSRYFRMIRGFDYPKDNIDKYLDTLSEGLTFVVNDLELARVTDSTVKQNCQYMITLDKVDLMSIFSPEEALKSIDVVKGNQL